MKGDILIINKNHIKAATQILDLIFQKIIDSKNKFIITIAGESGSGKSEIAESVANLLDKKNIKSFIFQQDDYFVYPPKTNAEIRKESINYVGISEVRINLINKEIKEILHGKNEITKPLVIFDENRIDSETIDLDETKVIIIEGTYTTILKNVNQHIFIDRNYIDTLKSREKRNREKQDDLLEKILLIEHEIISSHKSKSDIIVTKDYNIIKGDSNE
jgi:uridine kinase